MKVDTNQTSFTGGEFAASLFGRTDIAQYANACAEIENFLIRPYGSLISTPGTEFVAECKTGGSTSIVRLISFVFSRTDSYVIEVGVGYFRFYTDGAVVVSPGTTPYEIAHTFTAAEIPDIQFCQLNDVVYLAHKSHAPQKLTRYSSTSWSLSTLAFTGGPFMPDNVADIKITASATAGSVTLSVSGSTALFTPSGATLGHVNTFWKIGGTKTSSTTGLSEQGYVKITAVTNPSTATATVMKSLTTSAATDDWAEGSWSDVRGWPARVTFHQHRLFFARTDAEPQTLWGSKNFIYTDFAVDGGEDDDAINIQLASNESNDIKWLLSGNDLLAGTYGGEFKISTGEGTALTPATANAYKQTSLGSESILPQKIGNFYYYIQRFRKKLREIFYFWDLDTYKSVDRTILSPHISGDGGFIEMAYQQNPDTVLWCVCSNGTIATMTREVDQEIQGWSRQTTEGWYESVVTIPSQSGEYDEVWVVVRRTIGGNSKRYVERFANQEYSDRQDLCFFVHSGLKYNAYTVNTTATISLSATSGTSVIVTSSASYFSADDIGQRIRAIDADGVTVGELEILVYTSGTIVSGEVKYSFDATAYAAGLWGLSVSQISGLGHLEASTVTVLADGATDKPNKTVSSAAITLARDSFVVNVGLPYTQKIKTLPQEAGSRRGTSQGKIQRINQVGFKVNRSHKGFLCGGSVAFLEKINFRDPSTLMGVPESLYTGTIPNIQFRGNYEYGAQVLIQNSDPLPIELLSLMTQLDTNDN